MRISDWSSDVCSSDLRGCIPTKALLHSAEVADTARDAATVGVQATLHGIDPVAVRTYREGIVSKKFLGLEGLLSARGIPVVAVAGLLVAAPSVRVADFLFLRTSLVLTPLPSLLLLP